MTLTSVSVILLWVSEWSLQELQKGFFLLFTEKIVQVTYTSYSFIIRSETKCSQFHGKGSQKWSGHLTTIVHFWGLCRLFCGPKPLWSKVPEPVLVLPGECSIQGARTFQLIQGCEVSTYMLVILFFSVVADWIPCCLHFVCNFIQLYQAGIIKYFP